MTPERHARMQEIFQAAIDLSAAPRDAYLDEACGDDADLRARVHRLIEAADETQTISEPLDQALTATTPRLPGERIGPYEVAHEIGRGGMGSVYLAVRTDGVY